ncbi:GUN4 domain-containing protein [Spirulina sp. CCNP1310]|uniref:GUN4 domain-containing protein n=1 Tax=Spirulina sp. CCNP1310 TaxID=3110249 RepID=UPI002B21D456|nr:GUN4 domain-containing protein [Spirulina sp. CCNP1310]
MYRFTLKPLGWMGAIALLTAIAPPVAAQNNGSRLTCQTRATLNPGVTLNYRITGSLLEGAAQPQELAAAAGLALTVQWYDRNGQLQTLLRNAVLNNDPQLAPGGDYRQLPFEAPFRPQRHRGDLLYATPASVHGLYVSLRPTNEQPQQIQIVHALRSGEYVRSRVGTCQSEVPEMDRLVDEQLRRLQARLEAQDWAEADLITRRLLAPGSTPNPPFNTVLLSPEQIRTIDQLWHRASNGRFGLSVQLRVWQQMRAAHPRNSEAAVNGLRDRLGWQLKTPRAEEDFISSDWLNESELTYSLTAPVGHLPWVGVSDAVVQAVAVPPPGVHCGVCTVDAMQLRYDRFYQYIPQRMEQVEPWLLRGN